MKTSSEQENVEFLVNKIKENVLFDQNFGVNDFDLNNLKTVDAVLEELFLVGFESGVNENSGSF